MKRYLFVITLTLSLIFAGNIFAQSISGGTSIPLPKIGIDVGTSDSPKDVSVTLQLLLLMTILSLSTHFSALPSLSSELPRP